MEAHDLAEEVMKIWSTKLDRRSMVSIKEEGLKLQ
jgi:hypothetical protein